MGKTKGDVVDDSGWVQARLSSGYGGKRPGAGRKPTGKAKTFRSVGLSESEWAYLELWQTGASPSDQLRELLERAMKFWPSGPAKFR